ncbi:Lrp/AsnC family transcriptional regulator [uncultured Erythrobacter sp.]|uniref:Lrp/AsnC family transcriptional regulator n=1 Tax=uncultured Erythrobacter sp. TaxID=263913 RepID=UPI0026312B16|nr:Lrp/AsnC family transcriptional regulator [uncultured Erythrobacter sp.]
MDSIDRKLLRLLQEDSSYTVAEISERIGISSTPVWKRIKRLEESGVIASRVVLLDSQKIGLGLTGFVLVRTNDHSEKWLQQFANVVESIPEIVEMHRMAGDVDYLLKVVAPDIGGYDVIYKRIIKLIDLQDVSASFSMEVVKSTTALPLDYVS